MHRLLLKKTYHGKPVVDDLVDQMVTVLPSGEFYEHVCFHNEISELNLDQLLELIERMPPTIRVLDTRHVNLVRFVSRGDRVNELREIFQALGKKNLTELYIRDGMECVLPVEQLTEMYSYLPDTLTTHTLLPLGRSVLDKQSLEDKTSFETEVSHLLASRTPNARILELYQQATFHLDEIVPFIPSQYQELVFSPEAGDESVAKLMINFSHPWLKLTRKRDKYASGGPGRPVSAHSEVPYGTSE